ncbi:universal stress protein [Paenarthrobacter sp. Z7-10]|nr:universal stress protein [Paenarthrobacter sp. Z7-10]
MPDPPPAPGERPPHSAPAPGSAPAPHSALVPDLHRITGPILAAVHPGQHPAVIQSAAHLAFSLGSDLVCAYVDVTRYLRREAVDGTVEAGSIDPDAVDDDAERVAEQLRLRLGRELAPFPIGWSYTTLAGDPARALGRFAETINAALIVVGTRERGIGARLEELLTGSIAVHLTHRQHRPVVVVPLRPRSGSGPR